MARPSGREERHPPVSEGSLSIIAKGTCLTGDVDADGVVKVEGKVVGNIRAARQVLVGREGYVEGDIQSLEVIVGGHINGSIQAEERVELQASCTVIGDIATRRVLVEEGSRLDGALRMADKTDPATSEHEASPDVPPAPESRAELA